MDSGKSKPAQVGRPLKIIPPQLFGRICSFLEEGDVKVLFSLKMAQKKNLQRFYCAEHGTRLQNPSPSCIAREFKEDGWPEGHPKPDYRNTKDPWCFNGNARYTLSRHRCSRCRYEARRVSCGYFYRGFIDHDGIDGTACGERVLLHKAKSKTCTRCHETVNFCLSHQDAMFCCAGDHCEQKDEAWVCQECDYDRDDLKKRQSYPVCVCIFHGRDGRKRLCHPECKKISCTMCNESYSCVNEEDTNPAAYRVNFPDPWQDPPLFARCDECADMLCEHCHQLGEYSGGGFYTRPPAPAPAVPPIGSVLLPPPRRNNKQRGEEKRRLDRQNKVGGEKIVGPRTGELSRAEKKAARILSPPGPIKQRGTERKLARAAAKKRDPKNHQN